MNISYNYAYPASVPEERGDFLVRPFAMVADMDKRSKDASSEEAAWYSKLVKGKLLFDRKTKKYRCAKARNAKRRHTRDPAPWDTVTRHFYYSVAPSSPTAPAPHHILLDSIEVEPTGSTLLSSHLAAKDRGAELSELQFYNGQVRRVTKAAVEGSARTPSCPLNILLSTLLSHWCSC